MSCNRNDRPNRTFNGPLRSVVILARECFGDAIMLTPLIAALKKRHPETSIYVVAFRQIIFDFFSSDRNVTAVYHAKRDLKRYFLEFWPKRHDVLFNSKDHKSTSFLMQSRLVRARYRVGYRNNGNEQLFDHLLDMPAGTHESQRNLALLQEIDGRMPETPRPYIPEMPVSQAVGDLLGKMPRDSYVGINISVGTPGGHRTFEQWSDLIRNFPGERFVIFSSPGDIEAKRKLEAPHPNVLATPSTRNLYEVWKIVDRLKLLVTPDTSLVHVAACSDKPLVALYRFNPSDSRLFAPLSTLQEVLVSPTEDVVDIDNAVAAYAVRSMLERHSLQNHA
ncbi:MAG: glycosyltransferase family 9 protein [Chlorobiaceae bacterium]|nr:glycosyltransferase family 9 protein [Chlorobiaceae bacterium]